MAQKYETKTQKYNIVIILKVLLTRSRPYFLKLNKKHMESQGIAQHYSQIEKIDLQMQQTAHKNNYFI